MNTYNTRYQEKSGSKLTGVYKQLQGFGFVDTIHPESGEKKGYYVHDSKKLDALEGDTVSFSVKDFRGKQEAVIEKVIERSEYLIVGTLKIGKTFAFVIPENPNVTKDIFIPGKYIGGYIDGARVAVQILKWDKKNPEGRIIESLNSLPKGREDIYKIAFEMGARKTFPEKVGEEVRKLQTHTEIRSGLRKDCNNLLTYTIDGAESKDLDDALSIEKKENGYKLFVHIADVAHFVREGTQLESEAYKRATSIYLVDQVIPMLPPELSNGLCSLHPGEEKLTLTCEIDINLQGQVVQSKVYESSILSDFRLTYKEIDSIISRDISPGDTLQFGNTLTGELQKNIFLLKELTDILTIHTQNRGGLDFDFPETKISLDENGIPISYTRYERYDSYKIIEECMVLANESVARLFKKYPFLYRVHEDPDKEDIEKFLKIIANFDTNNSISSHMSFGEVLEQIKASPKLVHFQKLLLRSLAKARYSEKNIGHFGLGLGNYSHFTSPIRRYSDLQIHRIIKEIIHTKYTPKRKLHYKNILPEIARQCSEKSDKAEKIEYRVRDMLAVKYMADKVGQVFTGTISGITEKGFFVELENTIEGFVSLVGMHLECNSESMYIYDTKNEQTRHFGETIQVELAQVDITRFRIDFKIYDDTK